MASIFKIGAFNFRSLREVEIPLGPLNVIVGPNEAGKSNFLDVIGFLGDAVRTDLPGAIGKRGGWNRVMFRGDRRGSRRPDGPREDEIEIRVEASISRYASPTAPDAYTVRFWRGRLRSQSETEAVVVRSEWFTFKRTQGRGRRITVNGTRVDFIDERPGQAPKQLRLPVRVRQDSLALSLLPKLALEEGGAEIARTAELFSTFRVFDVDVAAAREPSPEEIATSLDDNGGNLAAFLAYLNEREPESFESLRADACALVPGLIGITFQPVGGSRTAVALELEEAGLRSRTVLGDASFGTVRLLALLAMLYDPDPPAITCVEEIDHGLHPYAFDRLAELLREASQRTQFLIATHSPAFVNRLRPSELIVCERDEETGESRIPALAAEEVEAVAEHLRGEVGLGEAWFSGTLGGVPR
jgi:predicted ATPase